MKQGTLFRICSSTQALRKPLPYSQLDCILSFHQDSHSSSTKSKAKTHSEAQLGLRFVVLLLPRHLMCMADTCHTPHIFSSSVYPLPVSLLPTSWHMSTYLALLCFINFLYWEEERWGEGGKGEGKRRKEKKKKKKKEREERGRKRLRFSSIPASKECLNIFVHLVYFFTNEMNKTQQSAWKIIWQNK